MKSWTDLSGLVSPKRIVCFAGELQTGFKDALRGSYEAMEEPANFASGRTSRMLIDSKRYQQCLSSRKNFSP